MLEMGQANLDKPQVIFAVAVIYILSSLVVQLYFMDDGYTHVQLHLMTIFLS